MPPLTVMIKPVSSLCNMRCVYCFYRDVAAHREAASYGSMAEDTLDTLVRRAFAYADGSVSFAFQGGEPTLAGLPFYERMVALQRKYNTRGLAVHNAIQTNGLLVDDAWAAFLARENFLVGVSLDGGRDTHDRLRPDTQGRGTYDRTLEAIERLRGHGAAFNILCVVTDDIARRPRETFAALAPYGFVQYIPCLDGFDQAQAGHSLSPERYGGFLKETFVCYEHAYRAGKPVSIRDFDNYLQMIAGYPPEHCGLGGVCGRYFLIEGDGSVYPCDFYVLDAWRLGNIREASFARLAKSPAGDRFIEGSLQPDKGCTDCGWFFLCRGGCRRGREPFVGGKPSRHRLCTAYQAFFEFAYPRMQAMAASLLGPRR